MSDIMSFLINTTLSIVVVVITLAIPIGGINYLRKKYRGPQAGETQVAASERTNLRNNGDVKALKFGILCCYVGGVISLVAMYDLIEFLTKIKSSRGVILAIVGLVVSIGVFNASAIAFGIVARGLSDRN